MPTFGQQLLEDFGQLKQILSDFPTKNIGRLGYSGT